MSSNLTVVEFHPNDGPAVAELWSDGLQQTVEVSPWMMRPLVKILMDRLRWKALSRNGDVGPEGANIASRWMESSDRCMLVAKMGSTVVGCCGVKLGTEEGGPELVTDGSVASSSIWRMSVSEKERRRGVGTELMRRAEQWSINMGSRTMYLVTANHRAGEFYQSLGYAKVSWWESLAPWYSKKI